MVVKLVNRRGRVVPCGQCKKNATWVWNAGIVLWFQLNEKSGSYSISINEKKFRGDGAIFAPFSCSCPIYTGLKQGQVRVDVEQGRIMDDGPKRCMRAYGAETRRFITKKQRHFIQEYEPMTSRVV